MKLSPKLPMQEKSVSAAGNAHVPGITASALSQHLRQMKNAGILDSEKQGMNVIYRSKDERIVALIDVIKENYCNSSAANT